MRTFDKQKWAQIRAGGYAKFIMLHGLLRWGIPLGLAATLGPFAYNLITHVPTSSIRSMVVEFILFALIIGYLMGSAAWRQGERAYHEDAS